MNTEFYTYKDAQELSGLSLNDYIDLQNGNLKKEEDIPPELFLSGEDEE